jgi:polyhydroxybutyrate depolymerase
MSMTVVPREWYHSLVMNYPMGMRKSSVSPGPAAVTMNSRRRIPLVLAVGAMLAVVTIVLAPIAVRAEVMKWKVDGVDREAIVMTPSRANQNTKEPLLFVFPWHGGTMQDAFEGMHFEKLWPEAIVVYMQGLPTKIYVDPLGEERGWQQEPGTDGDRDLKFFDAALATLKSKYPVDEKRIYSTGFSNGGIFTYLLWGTRANIFAAFAPVAAQIFPAVHLAVPKPLFHVAGSKDNVVPFKDQQKSIAMAREVNGSTGNGESCGKFCTSYASTKGAPVIAYIHGGGHMYPDEVSLMIVKFFKMHPLAD